MAENSHKASTVHRIFKNLTDLTLVFRSKNTSRSARKSVIDLKVTLPFIMIIGGVIGLAASFVLTYDKIHVLTDSSYQPACNLNPVLSCGSVMKTEQASLLGVPNTIFGLVAFSMLITVGLLLLSGSLLHKRIWQAMQIAAIAGVVFMHYLFFQGVFRIHAICPWCFVTWMITIPIFWYVTLYNLRVGNISIPSKANRFAQTNHGNILIVWYLIIFGILLERFWYYWSTLL